MTATAASGQLEIAIVPTTPIYTDQGTDAYLNVAIYQPEVPDGWYWLGNLALPMPGSYGYQDPIVQSLAPYAVIVQPLAPDAICSVTYPSSNGQAQPLWTDQGSHGTQNVQIWQPIPIRQGYSALGLFAQVVANYGGDPTSSSNWNSLCAVKTSLLIPGGVGQFIWNDEHSGAGGSGLWSSIALWNVTGSEGIIPTNTFVATSNYNNPPAGLEPSPNILQAISAG